MSKRLLITGAGGFLGSRFAQYFQEQEGYECVAVSRRELDITDALAVSAFIKAICPDYVLHCAAVSDTGLCEREPKLSERVNVRGTSHVAKVCREIGSRMIFMSSDQIYSSSFTMEPNREGSEPRPGNVYGRDKKRAEESMCAYLSDGVALRLSWMYDYPEKGRVENRNLLNSLLNALHTGQTLSLPVHDYRGITYVWEVVRHMEAAMALPGGAYNFGSENEMNTFDTAMVFLKAVAGETEAGKLLQRDEERFKAGPRNLAMNMERIKSHGITLSSTVQGIYQCCADYGITGVKNRT